MADEYGASTIRLLIDRNLRYKAVRAEGAIQRKKLKWGPHELEVDVHGYRGKKIPSVESELLQLRSLATIARLAKEGRLALYSSTELEFESFRASRGAQGSEGDIFAGVDIQRVESAVERSWFQATTDVNKHIHGNQLGDWCEKFLLKLEEMEIDKILKHYDDLPDFFRENLRNVTRYQELCRHLTTQDHYRDAFHLWTAEVNDLDLFLTGDRRFINAMTRSTKINLRSPPIAPADLLLSMGINPIDRIPLEDRRFMHLLEREHLTWIPILKRIYKCIAQRIRKFFHSFRKILGI